LEAVYYSGKGESKGSTIGVAEILVESDILQNDTEIEVVNDCPDYANCNSSITCSHVSTLVVWGGEEDMPCHVTFVCGRT